jgi:hypothetical protein
LDNNFTLGATLVFLYSSPDLTVTNFTTVDPSLFFDFVPMLSTNEGTYLATPFSMEPCDAADWGMADSLWYNNSLCI